MVLFTLGTPVIHRVLFTVTVCTFSSLALTDIFPKNMLSSELWPVMGTQIKWIIDPALRNPGKTRVHRCPILVSKCQVDLIFGYSTRAEEFWDGYRKASVFKHPGGRGAQGMGWRFDCFCWLWGGAWSYFAILKQLRKVYWISNLQNDWTAF